MKHLRRFVISTVAKAQRLYLQEIRSFLFIIVLYQRIFSISSAKSKLLVHSIEISISLFTDAEMYRCYPYIKSADLKTFFLTWKNNKDFNYFKVRRNSWLRHCDAAAIASLFASFSVRLVYIARSGSDIQHPISTHAGRARFVIVASTSRTLRDIDFTFRVSRALPFLSSLPAKFANLLSENET